MTDSELVCKVRAGDDSAFNVLMDRHADGLFGLAYSLVGSAADAEDVLQEAFLGAFRNLHSFEGRSAVKTWLIRIVVNQASKFRRSRRVRHAVSIEDAEGSRGERGNRLQSGSSAVAIDTQLDIADMLETLSPEHRQVVVLRELQNLSYEEIAQALQIPCGTVESRLHRARQQLKQRFSEYLT